MKGSCAAISGQNDVLGGGAPVTLNILIWPSLSSIIAFSICLASFLRSSGIDFGMAQPQMSSQPNGLVRSGPSGKRAAATLPAIFDLAGSLKVPHHSVSATVKAASPAMNTAFDSLRSYAGMPRGEILWVLITSHQNSTVSFMHGWSMLDFQPLAASTLL